MSRQILFVLSSFLCFLVFFDTPALLADDSWSIPNTQERRSSERFDIISWIRGQQNIISRQNAKYSRGGSAKRGPTLDLTLKYFQDTGTTIRTSTTIGKDSRAGGRAVLLLDDLITRGDRTKLINIDLGGEVFGSQTTSFTVDPSATQSNHVYQDLGGGMVIRPFGRSSQDTGLLVRGGYINMNETGLWSNTTSQYSMYSWYLGADAKIYLLNFLGIYAEYIATLEAQVDSLQGKWKSQRFVYGAFVEIFLVNVSAYFVYGQQTLTPATTNTAVNETYNGMGLSASLFF